MSSERGFQTIAFLGTYLPRKCGIATFTSDLARAVAARHPKSDCFVVAVNDDGGSHRYPEDVRFEIAERDPDSYLRAADFLNASNVDIICLQHEFGIFGGPAGSHLLPLLRAVRAPVVTTLHTVLTKPNDEQKYVMQELIAFSARLVVMTERARGILCDTYRVPPEKVDVIAHGIPDVAPVAPEHFKARFGISGRKLLLTFGLLSPNKGIEFVLDALPAVQEEFPDVVYVVLGATHPHELRAHGEAYRLGLEATVQRNGIGKNVIIDNRFVDLTELTEFIGAADLYVTPYLGEAQITSGTLAYAFGAGKAVISTPYWHAAELLQDGRGVLVPFADAPAIAREVRNLLRDDSRREALSAEAYRLGRNMVWSETAGLYANAFAAASEGVGAARWDGEEDTPFVRQPRELPEFNPSHLYRLTDTMGIFQHAILTDPNLSEGYCTDDNARALILAVLLGQLEDAPMRAQALATTYSAFLRDAFNLETRRFHNFLSPDGRWLDQQGSEDCHGRGVWALGLAAGRLKDASLAMLADQLFLRALPATTAFTSPRAWAFTLIGIDEYLRRWDEGQLATEVRRELTALLTGIFDRVAKPDWTWFEGSLTYDNAKLAHALLVSGSAMGDAAIFNRGIRALRWLVGVQTSKRGHMRPIGSNGFYRHDGVRADFDQQPIEAQTTVSACLEAFRTTSDPWWYQQAQSAMDWFLGNNDLGVGLYCPESGGCRDGLHPDRANENQGAESTLSFLLALAEMRIAQNAGRIVIAEGTERLVPIPASAP